MRTPSGCPTKPDRVRGRQTHTEVGWLWFDHDAVAFLGGPVPETSSVWCVEPPEMGTYDETVPNAVEVRRPVEGEPHPVRVMCGAVNGSPGRAILELPAG